MKTANGNKLLSDNWIYVQEPDVLVGRIQIFNNWSPYMVEGSEPAFGSGWSTSATKLIPSGVFPMRT